MDGENYILIFAISGPVLVTHYSYREAILDQHQFDNLGEVRQLTEDWILHYNHERPHQALGMRPPILNKAA